MLASINFGVLSPRQIRDSELVDGCVLGPEILELIFH